MPSIDPNSITPPAWLGTEATAFWMRNFERLARAGRIKPQHIDAWCSLCESWGLYERASRAMKRQAMNAKKLPPAMRIRTQALADFRVWCLRFGIDPATDLRISTLDGSDVGDSRPAVAAAARSLTGDRSADWMSRYGPDASEVGDGGNRKAVRRA